jgi:transposase
VSHQVTIDRSDTTIVNVQPTSAVTVPRQHIHQDLRDRFIRHIQSDPSTSISDAARVFGFPVSTAHSILRRVEQSGGTSNQQRRGQRPFKITAIGLASLAAWVDERPDMTLEQLSAKLFTEHAISTCKATISKALTRIGFTVKLVRTIPLSRNCPATVLARKNYAQMFLGDAPPDRRDIVWVDECGFNLHLRRKFGRARRGDRANLSVANNRGQNISVCASMSEDGFIHEDLRPGAFNTEHFCAFLVNLFQRLLDMGRANCWIVLDNVRFHHGDSVRLCAAQYGHRLVFLPPYSPMLNPIESLFGKWKTLIRTQGVSMNRNVLLERMAHTRFEISRSDCLGWIRDTNRNIGLALQDHIFE